MLFKIHYSETIQKGFKKGFALNNRGKVCEHHRKLSKNFKKCLEACIKRKDHVQSSICVIDQKKKTYNRNSLIIHEITNSEIIANYFGTIITLYICVYLYYEIKENYDKSMMYIEYRLKYLNLHIYIIVDINKSKQQSLMKQKRTMKN